MPNHTSLLQSFLASTSYRNQLSTKRDLMNVLEYYPSLYPKLDDFTFNDGMTRKLIHLDGTIPVTYRNKRYNIPISIWLLDTYPLNAPICFVKPTADMEIKVSRHVDESGKIYLPYLHDWKQPTSDLLALIQVCCVTFGENPPVYAKIPQDYDTYYPYNPSPQHLQKYPPPPLQPPAIASTHYGSANNTISEQHIRASLLSAVEDKLRRLLREEFESKQGELESLNKIKDELNAGKNQLTMIVSRLDSEKNSLEQGIEMLKSKQVEMENVLKQLEASKDLNLDEAINTTTPVYKQLLSAFAEEASIDDTIYYLGEGLRRGTIDCDTFLKCVRKLSRKQFLLRSLMMKCREKAGLPF